MNRSLGEVCKFYAGTGFPIEYQGNSSGKYPFYKVGDISKNVQKGFKYLTFCENFVGDDVVQKLRGTVIPSDTVVFAKIGEALKLNRRALTQCDCLVDNNAMGIKPVDKDLDSDYFFYFMINLDMKNYAEATAVPSVKKGILEKIQIPIPSIQEQKCISQRLNQITDLINERMKQLKLLDDLVKSRNVGQFDCARNGVAA